MRDNQWANQCLLIQKAGPIMFVFEFNRGHLATRNVEIIAGHRATNYCILTLPRLYEHMKSR
jgi:hypothetical protein